LGLSALPAEVVGWTGETADRHFVPLKQGQKVVLTEDPNVIIQRVADLGREYEKTHLGCCRCTVAALQDGLEFVGTFPGLLRTANVLDGSATKTHLHSCGGFTGSGIVIGWVCENEKFGDVRWSKDIMKKVFARFTEAYGTVICGEIRAKTEKDCLRVVSNAAKWAAEILIEEFARST
jgi:hypothetical protein